MPAPQFANMLRVLRREVPTRPTLFEFLLCEEVVLQTVGLPSWPRGPLGYERTMIKAFADIGYDYAPLRGSDFNLPIKDVAVKASRSMNDTAVISDRASFDAYPWPDPADADYSRLAALEDDLPAGMKLIVWGPNGGILESVVALLGYENLCYLLLDDPQLVEDIFTKVGLRQITYYRLSAHYASVGAMISNDDWGFNTSTMLAPEDLRRYVFPWHKRIVEEIHAAGHPAILHSCGNMAEVMDDIIDDMRFDGKHSYDDNIFSVEQSYERWGNRIAILGGLDVDFMCRATPAQIHARAAAMLDRTATRGGYALGTGNSVPSYMPAEHYFAMISATTKHRTAPVA